MNLYEVSITLSIEAMHEESADNKLDSFLSALDLKKNEKMDLVVLGDMTLVESDDSEIEPESDGKKKNLPELVIPDEYDYEEEWEDLDWDSLDDDEDDDDEEEDEEVDVLDENEDDTEKEEPLPESEETPDESIEEPAGEPVEAEEVDEAEEDGLSTEEEFAAINKVAEIVTEENPGLIEDTEEDTQESTEDNVEDPNEEEWDDEDWDDWEE